MKHLILLLTTIAPTFAHAVYHDSERRFICLAKVVTPVGIVTEPSIVPSHDPDDYKWVITTQGPDITVKEIGREDTNYYTKCSVVNETEFSCHPENDFLDYSTMFFFSSETKRFLMTMNTYWKPVMNILDPYVVAGECTEF